jgi:signal transduction histidine kinase
MRRGPSRKMAWVVGLFTALALLLSVAIPLFVSHRINETNALLNEHADPADKLTSAIQEALSHEVADIVSFQTTGNAREIQQYREQEDLIHENLDSLQQLATPLGPSVERRLTQLRSAVDSWHAGVDGSSLLKEQMPGEKSRRQFFNVVHLLEHTQRAAHHFNEGILNWREEQRGATGNLVHFEAILSVLFALAAAASIAMLAKILRDIHRLASDLELRATEEERLRHVAHALTGAFTLDDVLRRITETAAAAVKAESVFVELIDPGRKTVTCVAGYGKDVPPTGQKGPYPGSLAEEVLAEKQPKIIRDITEQNARQSVFGELARQCRHCTAMVIPLIADGEALGTLFLIRRHPAYFTESEFPRVRIVADMASLAISRAVITDRIQKIQREEHFLSDAASLLASSLDYNATLKSIVHLAVPEIADGCGIHLREGDAVRTVEVAHLDPDKLQLISPLQQRWVPASENDGGIARVIRTGKSELYEDITESVLRSLARDDQHFAVLQQLEITSEIIVPLKVGSEILGAMSLITHRGRHYGPSDLKFARNVARHVATAIQNARLYTASERAIRARDEVLRVVSHDLRNPVSNISMTATLLRSAKLSEDKRRNLVDMISRAAKRMNRLIEDLLTVSRVREGQAIPLHLETENPSEIIGEACALFTLQARRKSIDLSCAVDGQPLPLVQADRHRVLQVLSNLLDNAVKFTPEGGTITIEAKSLEGKVRFGVRDTGPGIEVQHVDKIFDLFWQVKPTTHIGGGFGLAISKAIVEQHGGTIWVESVPGRGTTFFFTLPEAKGDKEKLDRAS